LYYTDDFKSLIDWSTQMLESTDAGVVSNAHYYLGVSYSGIEEYDKALMELAQVLADKPKDTDALLARGSVYIYLDKFEEAIKDLTLHLSVDNKNVSAYYFRALAFSYFKKPLESLIDLNAAIDLDSTYSSLYNLRADVKVKLSDSLGARADYDKAIALNSEPDYALLYKRAWLAYRQLDDDEDALIYFDKVIAGAPNKYSDIYTARGYIHYNKSLFDKADADFQKSHELDSTDTSIYLQWALAKQGLKQHEESIRMLKLYLTTEDLSDESLVFTHYHMAKAMYELADYSHAIEEFNVALNMGAEYGEIHYWLAKSLIALKMNDEACAHFEKAHDLGFEGVEEDLMMHCGYSEGAFDYDED
jgi:tetratricopeptide (TPR) repeat protein